MSFSHNMIKEWDHIRRALAEEGVSEEAQEMVRRATAHMRHEWRTHEAFIAAWAWAKTGFEARALCFLEAQGLTGKWGGASRRHPAFEKLGRGRRDTPDGPAWTYAILCAAGDSRWYVDKDGDLAVLVRDEDGDTKAVKVRDVLCRVEHLRNAAIAAARYGVYEGPDQLPIVKAAARLLDEVLKHKAECAGCDDCDPWD